MRHAIVTTIGTSLLTNGAPEELRALLSRTANLQEGDYSSEDLQQVRARVAETGAQLQQAPEARVRRLSAELNGIVALEAAASDATHYLLRSDTLQGREAARLVEEWLRARGCVVVPQVLAGLSTADRAAFARGIDHLLLWCQQTLPALREQGCRITFNLVGSFKSLQAYAHTLGMFYADEIVYIFEGEGAQLIRIPRLPIRWETDSLRRHAAAVARLAAGALAARGELGDLPDAYVEVDGTAATLSEWGLLAWNLNRREILSGELLEQPGLQLTPEFRRDYERRRDPGERVMLQEALAKAATLWKDGGLRALRADGGLLYKDYANRPGIGHFRLNNDFRVSAEVAVGCLCLRHFGPHDCVNDDP